jgi:hypothetical protein
MNTLMEQNTDYEDWEYDYELISKKDYESLIKYREDTLVFS